MGQKTNGSTINATVSIDAAGGASYTFTDTFDMDIALTNLASSNAIIGSATNDKFDLGTSSGNVINTGKGNDIFYVDPGASGLGGNELVGGGGTNFVEVAGTSAAIDLTRSATTSGAATTGVAAVVAVHYATQQSFDSVNVSVSGMGTSALKSANGAAFASVVGLNGTTNVVSGAATFLGEVGANGVGYDVNGNVLGASQTAALVADETSVSSIEGNLAKLYFDDPNLNTKTQAYRAPRWRRSPPSALRPARTPPLGTTTPARRRSRWAPGSG